ncbi:complex I NDUFA9 subunit family protein [Thiobacter aerophilum]|uniref:Complex I NDUFA9 subunit family protein n=1 Tax=Thiobacter aerophilum TaxID=3121275 RepID=A0ABV0EEY5_9BURK
MEAHAPTLPLVKTLPKIQAVCVFGGSGFVGQHVVHRLHESGYRVRVPTRHAARAKALLVLPQVEVVEADVHDPATLSRLLAGMDAAINLVGILHEQRVGRVDLPTARRGDFHEVHVELPRRIIHACRSQGVRRLLHMSALNANPVAQSAYARSKGVGEALVREADLPHREHENWYLDGPKSIRGQAMATTVFRPSVIFGRGDSFLSLLARLVRRLPVIPLACPNARFQPVFVEDVARAFAEALENPATYGQVYELCGPKVYTFRELVEYVARLEGKHPLILPLSDRLSYWNAWLLEHLPGRLMTRDNYYAMQVDSVCRCPFPALFGFQPMALEAVAPHYIGPQAVCSRYDALRHAARR